jgi:hypothetical protein
MPLAFTILMYLFYALHVPACFAAMDSILAGEVLIGDSKLVSSNGRYALCFYHQSSNSTSPQTPNRWYLGTWFNKISKLTLIWVENRETPVVGQHNMSKLAISQDGNLAIFDQATKSLVWSAGS